MKTGIQFQQQQIIFPKMKQIVIPGNGIERKTPFFFAVEEYAAKNFSDDCFFIWQVQPTVMIGRNQLIYNEVNISFCKENDICICRRKSGGGAIYVDEGCLLFSYIVGNKNINIAFEEKMRATADAMATAGVEASLSGRNDLLINNKKVAGAAFYRCCERSIMHNSLLFSTDFSTMQKALTPNHSKLESKGIESVSQRVGNVSDYTNLSKEAFCEAVIQTLCGDEKIILSDSQLTEIEEIEKHIADEKFIYGNNPRYNIHRSANIDGAGTIDINIALKNNIIKDINFTGDFFLASDIDSGLVAPLKETLFNKDSVTKVLQKIEIGEIIRGLDAESLVKAIFTPQRKPAWLKPQSMSGKEYFETQRIINEHNLHTICLSGRCPNRAECWKNRTATFMTHGNICTRNCKFCNTQTGKPMPLDVDEPARVAESIRLMNLKYAVVTSVDRDDLDDLGAAHWAAVIRKIKEINPLTKTEVLIPDFQGRKELIDIVLDANPDVIGHNLETTRRLTPKVRSVAQYEQSLGVLRYVESRGFESKTGIMVGLGETAAEISEALTDIRSTGCRRITIGQYLQPTLSHLPVERYYTPEEFAALKQLAKEKGFERVESGPLVRSSYHADAEGTCG